ncbi:MAG: hypothetical protein GXY32_02010 [Ruminococcaceae bacterium]|nr:hypothetical protein [Oscillospiraceae bacterium]
MDMSNIGAAIAGLTGTSAQTGSGQSGSTDISGISFTDVLTTLMGTDAQGSGTSALGSMDAQGMMYAALLGIDTGSSWQSIQSQMLLEAMGSLLDSEQPVVTDPVLAQLMNLLKGLTNSDENNDTDILDVIAQLQKRLQQMAEENGAEMAGQQLLAMMSILGNDPTASATRNMPAEATATLLNMVLTSQPNDLVQLLTGGEPRQQTTQAFEQALQPVETPAATTAATAGAAQSQANTAATALEAEVLQSPQQAQTTTVAEGDARFAGMIRSVREQLMQTPTPTAAEGDAQETDIDTLQKQVDSGLYMRNTALAAPQTTSLEAVAEEQPVPVTTQLADSLRTALETGNEELTIRLKPEELGEVTLRLTKTASGMNLELFAKNPDTQRLLESQIDLLRDNLRPMKVDVQGVMHEDQFTSLSWQQQGFAGRQRNWDDMHGAAYYGDEPLGGTAAVGADPAMMAAAAPSSMLDTYI